MGIVIREADLEQDKDILIRTLNENRTRTTDERRYHWRYFDNPHGKARAWLAIDDREGSIAGFTVVHPRMMSVYGEDMTCWNCGDFSINRRYRSLGAAIKLRSAATQCVNQGDVPFLYAHPNDRMRIVHLKAGHKAIGQMVRYARVLRLDRYLPNVAKDSWLSEGLAQAYYKGLDIWSGNHRFLRSYRRVTSDGFPEGVDFDAFQDQVRNKWKIFGKRGYQYLKWRFGANPLFQVSNLLLYRGQEFVGYVLYSNTNRVMYVLDLFCLPEQDVFHALVAHMTEVGMEHKVRSISVTLFESNPVIQALQSYSYVRRPETSSVIVHTTSGMPRSAILQDKMNWFMTVGDRDV